MDERGRDILNTFIAKKHVFAHVRGNISNETRLMLKHRKTKTN